MTSDAIDRLVRQWNRERPDLDVSPTHVLQRITRLGLLQSASFAEVFGRFGMTFGEYEVLAALTRSGPPHRLKPSELVGALVLSSGRRGTLVALTAKGRTVVDEAVRAHLANEERLLSGISGADRAQLTRLLRKLLVSEAFTALDPAHSGARNGRTTDPAATRRWTRRR